MKTSFRSCTKTWDQRRLMSKTCPNFGSIWNQQSVHLKFLNRLMLESIRIQISFCCILSVMCVYFKIKSLRRPIMLLIETFHKISTKVSWSCFVFDSQGFKLHRLKLKFYGQNYSRNLVRSWACFMRFIKHQEWLVKN